MKLITQDSQLKTDRDIKGEALGSLYLALVSRRSVDGRDRDVVEAQVHAQLTAMMNDVAEDEAAERGDAGHREHFLPAPLERPASQVLRVALVHPRPCASGVLVEGAEDLGA